LGHAQHYQLKIEVAAGERNFQEKITARKKEYDNRSAGSFSGHRIRAVFHGNMVHGIPAHLHDSTADRYFGEPQHLYTLFIVIARIANCV
jgi:hypothetical protein